MREFVDKARWTSSCYSRSCQYPLDTLVTPMFYQIHLSGVDRPGCTMLYQDVYSVRLKFIVTAVRPPKIRIWVQRACLRRCLRIYIIINSYSFERRESILQDPSFTMAKQSLKTQVTSSDARMRTGSLGCVFYHRKFK